MRMLKELAVDGGRMTTLALAVQPHHEWSGSDGERKRSEDQSTDQAGTPLWEVSASMLFQGAADTVKVIVPAKTEPSIEAGKPIVFDDLRCELWAGRSGLGGRFYASGVSSN